MSEEEVIPVHKESWGRRELLQRVLSRYCHVLEDIGGRTPTYLVTEKENEDMHEVLIAINQHLGKLSYSARLYPDDPWIIQLIPHPTNQWPSPKFIASMWILSILTTLLAGEMWMDGARPEDGWFFSNVTLDAFVGYTVPLFGALIFASFVQKWVAAQKESTYLIFSLYPVQQWFGGHLVFLDSHLCQEVMLACGRTVHL